MQEVRQHKKPPAKLESDRKPKTRSGTFVICYCFDNQTFAYWMGLLIATLETTGSGHEISHMMNLSLWKDAIYYRTVQAS